MTTDPDALPAYVNLRDRSAVSGLRGMVTNPRPVLLRAAVVLMRLTGGADRPDAPRRVQGAARTRHHWLPASGMALVTASVPVREDHPSSGPMPTHSDAGDAGCMASRR